MNYKKFLPGLPFIALLAAVVAACVSATVTEPSACDSQSVSFTAPPVSVPVQYQNPNTCASYSMNIPDTSVSTPVNVADAVSKLKDVASNLTVNVTGFTVDNSNGQFDWVKTLNVSISSANNPPKLFATINNPTDGEISPQVVMSSDDLFIYLSDGQVSLTLTLQGQTLNACDAFKLQALLGGTSLNTSVNLCVSASGKVTKSL